MTGSPRLLRRLLRRSASAADVPSNTVPAPQRILITQRELKNFGGSEFFAIEVARALKNRGREVAIYCPAPGKLANIVTPSGIPVCETPAEVPFTPDVIHGQHHLPTMAALAHFPDTPAIYCWHGARPWVERPPVHPRIRFHVVTSQRMAPRLATETAIPEDRIITIPNFVDLERFSRVRKTSARPTRAVLYGQSGFYPAELELLEKACADHAIALDKVGYAYGNPRPRPEYFLPDYDIAFAIGRSAIEAAASGCAVIPVVPQLAGSLVVPDTLDDWAASNFSPRYFTSASVMDSDWLSQQLAHFDQEKVREVTQLVRSRFPISLAINAFESLYRRARTAEPAEGSGTEFGLYLTTMAHEVDGMWGDLECRKADEPATKSHIAALEAALSDAENRTRALTDKLLECRPTPSDSENS